MLIMLYFCSKDSPDSRKRLPTAIILAFVTDILLVVWVIVYIWFIYPRDEVFVGTGDRADDGEEETNYSRSPSKPQYIFWAILLPLLNIPYYIYSYYQTKDWVRKNEGYQNSN